MEVVVNPTHSAESKAATSTIPGIIQIKCMTLSNKKYNIQIVNKQANLRWWRHLWYVLH